MPIHSTALRGFATAAALLTVANLAPAQENSWFWEVEYSNPAGHIASAEDTATITLWAAWDPEYYAFRGALLDVAGDDPRDASEWVEWYLLVDDSNDDGTVDGASIRGVRPFQIYWPYDPPYWPDTSNPIAAWTATWRTADLTPRDVTIQTVTESFEIYSEWEFGDYVDGLTEGRAVIAVVPAPGLGSIPLAALLAILRRRR